MQPLRDIRFSRDKVNTLACAKTIAEVVFQLEFNLFIE